MRGARLTLVALNRRAPTGFAEANGCVPHMPQVLNAARTATLRVFYAMHHRYRPGDYETWKYIAPIQKAAWARKTFEYGTWGGEFRAEFTANPGEVVVQEHWCSSGFANTDLDLQLKKHGIHQLIVIGLIAHTCVEATVRYAAELGYDVTVVRDATADYSDAARQRGCAVAIRLGLARKRRSRGSGELNEAVEQQTATTDRNHRNHRSAKFSSLFRQHQTPCRRRRPDLLLAKRAPNLISVGRIYRFDQGKVDGQP
jgi:nicotinamidase-related amidase